MEKKIFEEINFHKKYNVIGDFDFFIKISQTYKIGSIQEPLDFYRIHNNSYSLKRSEVYINELSQWIQENEKRLKESGFNLNKQKIFLYKLKIKAFLKKIINK